MTDDGSRDEGFASRVLHRGWLDKSSFAAAAVVGAYQILDVATIGGIKSLLESIVHRFNQLFGSSAHAAEKIGAPPAFIMNDDVLKLAVLVGVYLILFGCFLFALTGKRTKSETDRAWDVIKIIAGFFIGTLAK